MVGFPFFLCSVKVLILHQHFNNPEKGGAMRSYYLAKALVDRGIETVVITGGNEKEYKAEKIEGIVVHYLSIPYDNAFGFYNRSFSFLRYAWRSFHLAKTIPNVDFCYAISVPLTVGLSAMWLKRRNNVPYVFEVGDLWPDAPIQMGFIKNYFFIFLLYKLEKLIYKNAASIVALSVPIKDAIEKKISGKKIDIIPNIADCDFYQPGTKIPLFEEKIGVKGKFVVSYIGAAGVANGLDYFIESANACRKADLPIHFILCGDGAELSNLKVSTERLDLKNISFTGFVNRATVKEIMTITDAVFVCYKNVPILQTGSPNKYFDGLASGKMIIANFGGWIKEEIESAECGIGLDPKHPSSFVEKIEPFLREKIKLNSYQQSARHLAESKYDRKKLSDIFAGIFLN
jgi:glycosyltransferase involved in cell wall biosynthesis